MISIIDYGMGNVGSVVNMLRHIGATCEVTRNPQKLEKASKILLPGVGAFDAAVSRINNSGLREILEKKASLERIPILGICLGMQLLTRKSEEGTQPGLGWIPGKTRRLPNSLGIKIPHMGWNQVKRIRQCALTDHLDGEIRFYFVHSYFVEPEDPKDTVLSATHGCTFAAAIQRGNIMGAQFHPEKSHRFGLQLLKNFAGL